MLIELGNDVLKIKICTLGAEMISLQACSGLEYMWQGDPGFWESTSPLLFPTVGCLKDGFYIYNGERYELPVHGFARSEEFVVGAHTNNEVTLSLVANDRTRINYPFEFSFDITFKLNGARLEMDVVVGNNGDCDLPFSFGLHPGFAHSWVENDRMENYRITFSSAETSDNIRVEGGLLSTDADSFLEDESVIDLTDDHFAVDAIVLKAIKSEQVTLSHQLSEKKLTMDIRDFPDFALWSQPGAGFICLEPWQGHADRTNHNHDIWQKEGILTLTPNKTKEFHSSLSISGIN